MPEKKEPNQLLADALRVATGIEWTREHRPHDTRRWRIDIAQLDEKIAVEVDGRCHSSAKQHRSDCEKQNYLVASGWRCFRYPASSVQTKKRLTRIVDQINRSLCGVEDAESDGCVLNGD